MLLIAASDETGDVAAIGDAAVRLGLDAAELGVAERHGLVRVDGTVAFRHPLVRSAVYRSASREDRKAVHEALAAVVGDSVRAAWHRALVADRPDEAIAEQLERAATQAVDQGAHATASTAFERAAALSEQPALKGIAAAARGAGGDRRRTAGDRPRPGCSERGRSSWDRWTRRS